MKTRIFSHSLRSAWVALVASSALIPSTPLRAESANAPVAEHFAHLANIDLDAALPPPPAPGSLADKADLETDLEVQASRTGDQIQWAKFVANFDPWGLFAYGNLLGSHFTQKEMPHLAALVAELRAEGSPVYKSAKQKFSRTRPYALDSRVHPVVELPEDFSYPSGHTYSAYNFAELYSEVFPEKRAQLFERARSIAWSRVVGGVHYPTDLEGGKRLSAAVMAEEQKNPAFQAAVEECRVEAAKFAAQK